MFSESERRAATAASVENNQADLSGNVTLVQENQGPVQAGNLLYLPIYKKNMPLNNSAERWQALEGFVYAAFRMGDLINDGLPRGNNINFTLYAGETANKTLELYNSLE